MEKKCAQQPLVLEKASKWLFAKSKEYSLPLLASFLFGALAYMFIFTSKLVNHDDVSALFSKGGSVVIGRWGLELVDKVLPNYSMPWLYGVLSIALLAAAVCVIIHIFHVRSKLLQVLLAGTIIVFPSMIGMFPYMFMSATYSGSFLFSILAVWLVKDHPKWGFLPAVGLMVFSLSIYQAHVSVAASLLVLVVIQRLLYEDEIGPIVQKGIFFVFFLIVSLGLYYAATQLVLKFYGIEFAGYASGSLSFSLANIPADIAEAYKTFFQYIFHGYLGLIPTLLSRRIHYLFFIAVGILFVIWAIAQKGKNIARFLLLGAMLVIFPLAINCMHLFATNDSIHTLVLYGFVAVYVLAAVIADACISLLSQGKLSSLFRQAALNVVTLAMAVTILINTYISNESYLNLYLRYENAYAFYTSLIADIKMMPQFSADTKLAIIGAYDQPDYYAEKFPVTHEITGVYGFLPDSYSNNLFVEYYIGFPIEFASMEEIEAIQDTPEYQQMPVYPYYGSMQLFEDILAVKLS